MEGEVQWWNGISSGGRVLEIVISCVGEVIHLQIILHSWKQMGDRRL